MKGKIKEKWGNLTDDDLDVINGRRAGRQDPAALRKTRPERMSTIGSGHCLE
jgi:hypothetical protein